MLTEIMKDRMDRALKRVDPQVDLPIDQSQKMDDRSGTRGSRREFLHQCATGLGGITLVGFVTPLLSSCDTSLEPRDSTNTGGNNNGGGNNGGGNNNGGDQGLRFDVSGLTADGEGVLTEVDGPDGYPILIARVSEGSFTALSTRCTHQGCEVNPPASGSIQCPCHGSRFNLDGSVINGPASSPLRSYQVTFDQETNEVVVIAE